MPERFTYGPSPKLGKGGFATVLKAQTHGAFFDAHPMVFYGSSPLSYACVFGLKSLVLKLLETDLVRLDQDHCVVCGLLPLHGPLRALGGLPPPRRCRWQCALPAALPEGAISMHVRFARTPG